MDGFDGSFVPTTPWADGLSSFQGPSEQYRNQPNGQMMGNLLFEDYDDNLLNFPADDNGVGLNYDVVNPPHFFPANNQIAMESHQCNLTAEELYTLCGGTETGNPAFCVDRGSVGCNDSGPTSSSVFPQEPQSTSGVPRFWGAPTYSCVPPPPLRMDHHHGNLQQFGAMQGGFLNNGGRRFVTNHNGGLQGSGFQTLPNGHCQNQKNLHNSHNIGTFTPVSQMRSTTTSINQVPQIGNADLIQHYPTHAPIPQPVVLLPGNVDNGAPKPRRAKRGQATDPHSIAERLRREKISDRMKSLQELVPNSSKTDKASMLGEIIDYVKFLQLQVKVLSISRVGAAGASTDIQSEEESDNVWLSPLEDTDANPLEGDDDDNSEFEQEVVKLMESNVTQAMQFLQTKGLCLMPTTLASAISNRKGSSSAAIPLPPKTKRPVASSTHATSFNNESSMKKESDDRFELPRSCNGTVIKQEDPQKSPTSNCRELVKPPLFREDHR